MSSEILEAAPAAPRVARGSALLRARELGIGLAIIIVFVVATVKNSSFAHADSVQQLLTGAALIALLGVGETLVIVTRNVDLSVGSVVGLSAYVVGMTFKNHPHMPVLLGFVLGIAIGAVVGAINGLVTTVARVPSLVVTLAALYIIRGIDGVIVNGVTIDPGSVPKTFQEVGYQTFFGVPWLAIIVAVVVGVVGYAMRSFRAARDLYAIGSNPEAAALAGIPSERRVFTAFVVSGSLAGLAGALFLALHAQVDVTAGSGYEFLVVAAVVVGGVAIFGGSGTVLGAALGALLLNTINQALVASKVSAFWNDAIAGGLLLAAIAFDRWLSLRVAHSLQSAEGHTAMSDTVTKPLAVGHYGGVDSGNEARWRGLLRWEAALVVVLVAVLIFGSSKSATFLSSSTFFFTGLNMGEIAIMALPLLLIVMVGEIDLSVASMLGLSGAVMGSLFQNGTSIWLAMAAALVVGALGGALNGLLIAKFGLPSIAVTIGTLTLFRGVAEIILTNPTTRLFPTSLTKVGVVPIHGTHLAYSAAIFIVLAIVFGVVLHATPLGRSLYAIGLQPEAAQFSGIRVNRIKLGLYVLSGVLCAFAGILFTLKNASASYGAGTGLELTVVAIVLFGGVSIFGGRGTVLGVVISVVIVGALQQALTQMHVQPEVQNIVTGTLLLISVLVPNGADGLQRLRTRVRRRAQPAGSSTEAEPHR